MIRETGGFHIGIKRKAANIGRNDADGNVENPLRAEGIRAADLEGEKPRRKREIERAKNGPRGAEERVGAGEEAGAGGIDVDLDGGRVGVESGVVDAEEEFVVPGGGGGGGGVEARAEAVGRVEECDGVGVEGPGGGEEVLRRD